MIFESTDLGFQLNLYLKGFSENSGAGRPERKARNTVIPIYKKRRNISYLESRDLFIIFNSDNYDGSNIKSLQNMSLIRKVLHF